MPCRIRIVWKTIGFVGRLLYAPRLLLHSCIRSFRAWLWVTVFATMISAIVMIWLCLEGHHGIGIVGKSIYNFVCIHLKHCLMSLFLQQLWRFDGSEYHNGFDFIFNEIWVASRMQWEWRMEPEDPINKNFNFLKGTWMCVLWCCQHSKRGGGIEFMVGSVMDDHEAVANRINLISWGKKL